MRQLIFTIATIFSLLVLTSTSTYSKESGLKGRVINISAKVYDPVEEEWGDWSDWSASNYLFEIDTEKLIIYTDKIQEYDILRVDEDMRENNGKLAVEAFIARDSKDELCSIILRAELDERYYVLYIYYQEYCIAYQFKPF